MSDYKSYWFVDAGGLQIRPNRRGRRAVISYNVRADLQSARMCRLLGTDLYVRMYLLDNQGINGCRITIPIGLLMRADCKSTRTEFYEFVQSRKLLTIKIIPYNVRTDLQSARV